MAFTIESLIPLIHHEKQERGSMLCAQHALNALLQEPIFSVTDLAQIAKSLDDLEDTYSEDRGHDSVNMDDSGFFSVQVLEKALDVWGLSLTRWASEEMKEYRDHPETQLGFILNHQQHWFALRRFGNLSPDPYEPATSSHWFNLNSYLAQPEWVGNAYLGALLAQAQQDGYSIFAVIQKDPNAPLALPKTDADRLAENVAPPNAARTPRNATTSIHPATDMPEGMEDEDYELQAAIAASMGGEYSIPPEVVSSGAGSSSAPAPAPPRAPPRAASSIPGGYPPGLGHPVPMDEDEDDEDEDDSEDVATLDPVEASRRRNERLLAQFQRAQGNAVREMGYDETARQRERERQAEEAEFQRVLAESEALAREQGHFESPPPGSGAATPAPAPARNAPRVYDDEDEELQAALRASLESVPADFVLPESPRAQRPPAAAAPAAPPSRTRDEDDDDAMTEVSVATEPEGEPEPPQQEELTPAEMRRRRLAALERRAAGGGG